VTVPALWKGKMLYKEIGRDTDRDGGRDRDIKGIGTGEGTETETETDRDSDSVPTHTGPGVWKGKKIWIMTRIRTGTKERQ
jgi:hypothetical protein